MADLITLEQALAQIPTAQSSDNEVIAAMISAASATVENYCRRTFTQQTFDELYTVQGVTKSLFVRNPPITQVNQLRSGKLPALYVLYRDPGNQTQQATVQVTSSAVILTLIYNTVTTVNTFPFTSYPTFGALGAAINALGNNWQATIPNQFALWETSDLTDTGNWSARNITVALLVYWWGIPYYLVNSDLGEIYNPGGYLSAYQQYRVNYVGGFNPIPAEVQQAVATLVQQMYLSRNLDPNMSSETIDKYSYTRLAQTTLDGLGLQVKLTLNNYKLTRVARFQ